MYTIATKFLRLYPCFWGRATRLDNCGDYPTCGWAGNRRWRSLTESRYDITHISARSYSSYEIPAAIPNFWGRATRLDYCGDCSTCRFVRSQRWCIVTSGNGRHLQFLISPHDERAEIFVVSCLIPVYGCHLWFVTHPDVRQYFH